MRLHPTGSPGSPRRVGWMLSTAVLLGLGWPTAGPSQTTPEAAPAPTRAKTEKPAAPGPVDDSPLGRYAPREGLVFYVEFAGLDAHADAWKRTAAYRMLTSTSLGPMLEDVGAQVFDRMLQSAPNRKINGAELVSAVEQMARRGWMLALNADAAGGKPPRATIVLRGAVAKENRALFGRLVGSFMNADSKAKIERKSGRAMIVVPRAEGAPAGAGWVWWGEKDDLVVGIGQNSDTPIPAVLDGKAQSAADHPVLAELKKAEGGFTPVLAAFVDPAGCPPGSTDPMVQQIAKLDAQTGVKRLDYRWGFEDEALKGVARLVAPSPRKGALAFFEKPAADPKAILPVPDGVEYFASLSLKPEQMTALFSDAAGGGPLAGAVSQLANDLQNHSRVDFQKDFLAHLGPRIMLYLAPAGASAVVDADQGESGAGGGGLMDPSALIRRLSPSLPSPVLAAEVNDPAKFGRSLDALMVEINRALKARTNELAAEAAKAAAEAKENEKAQGSAPSEPEKRKRDHAPDSPEFRMLPGANSAAKIYLLNIPKDTPMKGLPSGFKPSVRLEGNHVAFSTSPQAARVAIEALQSKAWAPPQELERTLSKTPDNTAVLLYGDSRETTSTILASLPGTLQSIANTFILAAAQAERIAESGVAPGSTGGTARKEYGGMSGRADAGSSGGAGDSASMMGSSSSSAMMSSGSGSSGFGGAPQSAPGSKGGGLIQIRVDPQKLPRADELKGLMFPSTTAVVADDDAIRIVTRGAFPDLSVASGMAGAAPAALMPSMIAASSRAKAAREAKAAKEAKEGDGQGRSGQPGQSGFPQPGQPGQPGPAAAPAP